MRQFDICISTGFQNQANHLSGDSLIIGSWSKCSQVSYFCSVLRNIWKRRPVHANPYSYENGAILIRFCLAFTLLWYENGAVWIRKWIRVLLNTVFIKYASFQCEHRKRRLLTALATATTLKLSETQNVISITRWKLHNGCWQVHDERNGIFSTNLTGYNEHWYWSLCLTMRLLTAFIPEHVNTLSLF